MDDKLLIENEIIKFMGEEQNIRKKLVDLRRNLPREEVSEYSFPNHEGTQTKFSELFSTHNELIVIHNMGKDCPYCTMWADGFNGLLGHLENRAGFVVISPDTPDDQKKFALGRGWKFKMLSGQGNTFTEDMGFKNDSAGYLPGVSTFIKEINGKIYRAARDSFGPGDSYCAAWNLFDLLPGGTGKWRPKFNY